MITVVVTIAVLLALIANCSDVSSDAATANWIRLRQDPRYTGFKQDTLQKLSGHLNNNRLGHLAKIIDGTASETDSVSERYAPFATKARYVVDGPGDDEVEMVYDSRNETIKVSGEMGPVIFTMNYRLNDPTQSTFLIENNEDDDEKPIGIDNLVLRGTDLPQGESSSDGTDSDEEDTPGEEDSD